MLEKQVQPAPGGSLQLASACEASTLPAKAFYAYVGSSENLKGIKPIAFNSPSLRSGGRSGTTLPGKLLPMISRLT